MDVMRKNKYWNGLNLFGYLSELNIDCITWLNKYLFVGLLHLKYTC